MPALAILGGVFIVLGVIVSELKLKGRPRENVEKPKVS
jgi:hypothetical protein